MIGLGFCSNCMIRIFKSEEYIEERGRLFCDEECQEEWEFFKDE